MDFVTLMNEVCIFVRVHSNSQSQGLLSEIACCRWYRVANSYFLHPGEVAGDMERPESCSLSNVGVKGHSYTNCSINCGTDGAVVPSVTGERFSCSFMFNWRMFGLCLYHRERARARERAMRWSEGRGKRERGERGEKRRRGDEREIGGGEPSTPLNLL